jgi:hypothetical protein
VLYPVYSSPNVINIIKRKMRWVRIACMGQLKNITLSGGHHLKELGRDRRMTFKWNLKD